ncbi:MAG TPA: SRPBCC family protein [Acidimicrobiia bacterium]|nr:SRPBCC family protein [Acidimicrobiia bacterium]
MPTNRIDIDAPPEKVWRVLIDPTRYAQWVVGTRRIRDVDPSWPARRARFHHALGLPALELHDTTSIVDMDAPRRLELEVRFRPAGLARVVLSLRRLEGDRTRLTMREDSVRSPVPIVRPPVVEPVLAVRNWWSLRRLARIVALTGGAVNRNGIGSALARGALAGTAGKAALDTATYLDMLVRGRPRSDMPSEMAGRFASRAGLDNAFDPDTAQGGARRESLGALLGTATGVGVGVAYAVVTRGRGFARIPFAGLTLAAGAMVAGNASAVVEGLTHPSDWGVVGWLSDVVPHLAFGFATAAVFDALTPRS